LESWGVIIGGFLATLGGVVTSLLNHYLRARREDKVKKEEANREDKLRKEELTEKRIEAAHEYFRGLYGVLAPFLRADSVLGFYMPFYQFVEGYEGPPQMDIQKELNAILNATKTLIDGGYAALFPDQVFKQIKQLNYYAGIYSVAFQSKSIMELSEEEWRSIDEILNILQDLRGSIRYLLNVDALELP